MMTQIVSTLSRLLAVEKDWHRLAWSDSSGPIFQSPAWVLPWWNTFGAGQQLNCIAVYESSGLVGFVPLMLTQQCGLRTLRFIGWPLNDRNAFLAIRGKRCQVGEAVFEYLASNRDEWDELALDNIDEFRSAIGVDLADLQSWFSVRSLTSEPAVSSSLSPTWHAYCRNLPKSRYREMQYRERRMRKHFSPELVVITEPNEIISEVSEFEKRRLAAWKARNRYHELPLLTRSVRLAIFLQQVCQRLSELQAAYLAHLRVEKQPIASGLYMAKGKHLHLYLRTYDGEYQRYSPGIILDWLMMKYAIDHGFEILDYGRGDEPYKFLLGGHRYDLRNLLLISQAS